MFENMKSALSRLSLIGKALMLPISILPAAGLLLAFGAKLDIPLMMRAGGVIFDNLPLLFAVGAAVGLTKESGIAALAAIVALVVMNATMGVALNITPEMAMGGGRYAMVMGIPSLQTGVFGGLIAGILAAVMYQRFYQTKLPDFLGFFAGKRFVPIITAFTAFLIGLVLPHIWSYIQSGIDALSHMANSGNMYVSTFIYGFMERALIPVGLHHIFYSPYWFSFGEYTTAAGTVVNGDHTIWFKMLEDGVTSFSTAEYQEAGKFLSGNFAIYMFAFPAACLAMYHEAKDKNKKIAAGILGSAALTSFVTGITEPVEFAFIFVAPLLYVFSAIMAGVSYAVTYALDVHIGKTFSAGIIDFVSFGVLPAMDGFKTNWINVILWGSAMSVIYYVVFRFAIRKFDFKTVGREDRDSAAITLSNEELAKEITVLIGGKENITNIGACITRLRLQIKDQSLVKDEKIKALGAMGVIKVGSNGLQIILGSKAQFVADIMNSDGEESPQTLSTSTS
ncbi:putative PTS system EIICB component [Vibrio nigripulchritudo MADA3029]|uniref:PTS transporter subunit EIIC n=1 Tax=Vibrio nigripulchritudo TaxID=28173 RepID=UPI0003B1EF08|nr:PTS transporter subunit EIIC [Vibrio nigripulchritudo]CCN45426.1 putative PTS system EIICB component [Vibrio nigripulchritudo MADA3020]CCN53692.1 putative PTS system EIICB component [Vibrio nigripulchritudo MADA3021]CCN58579.1 putative PTS system EIICB component [Vibrio nigripulchritudo MADA3029]